MASKEVVLEGVVLYANLPPRPPQKSMEPKTPNDTFYSVHVEVSEQQFKDLKKEGLPSLTLLRKFPEDYANKKTGEVPTEPKNAVGKTFIQVRASKYKENTSIGPITFEDVPVGDLEGYVVEDSIANGSTAKVYTSLDDLKGRPGKALRLKKVIVTDLIVYEGGSGNPFKKRPTDNTETPFHTAGDDSFLGE